MNALKRLFKFCTHSKKRMAATIAVVCVLAFAGTALAQWFFHGSVTGSATTSSGYSLTLTGQPLNLSTGTLDPIADPGSDTNSSSAVYPISNYVQVANSDTRPLAYKGMLELTTDTAGLAPYVHVRIWAEPTNTGAPHGTFSPDGTSNNDDLMFSGTLSQLAGNNGLIRVFSTVQGNGTPLAVPVGGVVVYRVVAWLDAATPSTMASKSFTVTLNFAGGPLDQYANLIP